MNIDFTGAFIFVLIVGIIIGLVFALGIPFLWDFIKPFIHLWSAP